MKFLNLKRFCISLLAGFIWTLILGGTAQAIGLSYRLYAYSNNNMSAQAYIDANGAIADGGYWRPAPTSEWFLGNGTLHALSLGDYTVYFRRVRDFYVPASEARYVDNDYYYTNYYHMYSNSLAVVVTGLSAGATAIWKIDTPLPGEYTNSSAYSAYGTGFTNNRVTISNIPAGDYTITFNSSNGYTTPSAVTTNIAVALANFVTGTYARVRGTITVTVSPTNGSWTFTTYPSDFTNYSGSALSSTNSGTLTNAPVGTYTIHYNDLGSPYVTPADQTQTNTTSSTNLTFAGTYLTSTQSWLTVFFMPLAVQATAQWKPNVPGASWYDHLDSAHLDNGYDYIIYYKAVKDYYLQATYTLSNMFGDITITNTYIPYTNSLSVVITGMAEGTNATWSITSPSEFTNSSAYKATYTNSQDLSPIPTGSYAITFNNVYGYIKPANITTNITGALNPTVTGAYVYISLSSTNDSDGDGLPDGWEIRYGLNPYDPTGTNGPNGNVDDDWIPSKSAIPPTLVSIDANGVITYSGVGGVPGYPLSGARLYDPYSTINLGYASTNIPFNNLLECRGLDGYYQTNGPAGVWVPDDDPYTDPTLFETMDAEKTKSDGISDGWRYYFWYWRSANAATATITNSANLDWVKIAPSIARWGSLLGYSDLETDTDLDGINDGLEYADGTDPTHCDTDADSMDDWWEITFCGGNSNALNNANNSANPDGDFMAWVNQGVLTVGMVGTALGTNVCYVGAAATPRAAWVDQTRNGIFNLYTDIVIRATSLTNLEVGAQYGAHTNYYGTSAGLTSYKNGYAVFVDMDNSGTYSAGDYALVNPTIKHDAVYSMAPAAPYPGVCSFNPYTAWTNIALNTNGIPQSAPNTVPYTTYQEYLGGDLIGRLSWDAGGQMSAQNDPNPPTDRNSYTLPVDLLSATPPRLGMDSDSDLMPDGWELYTGLNPNSNTDAGSDPDDDQLNNLGEWANAMHLLGTCSATWPLKLLPTDPGVITAPQPNDPHPKDTDWDGLTDSEERTPLSNPCAWDTDGDYLPDGWELYAGTSITNSDALADPDGDGLLNYQEYWCGTVPEWMLVNPAWQTTYFCVRRAMTWDPFEDPDWGRDGAVFIPPDYISDPCFMYTNAVYTDVGYLRTNYPAASALLVSEISYHTPLANNADSDGDNMDDYWEVYHGLNPCRGNQCLVIDYVPRFVNLFGNVDEPDADPNTAGYQFGTDGNPFNSLLEYIQYVEPFRNEPDDRIIPMQLIVGPFNLGLNGMDPDGDGLPNLEEYSYNVNRTFYHTDPTPIWRTDQNDANSFINNNYRDENAYWWEDWDIYAVYPFKFEMVEGYDTDNDGMSDYAEINSAAGQTGNNPLDDRNPIRNRALYCNGTNDFTRQVRYRTWISESDLTRFCVEAWIKPNNPSLITNQVVMEKAGLYNNPLNPGNWMVGANFRMGITNGLPYVLYNGRGSLRAYQATAQTRHRVQSNTNWTHIAGSYDGTNLIIYVNGEESYSLRSTELPANGFDVWTSSNTYSGTPHTLMVGARDNNAGLSMQLYYPSPANYFGGCIDEVRVWDGARTRAEILANKDRRLTQLDITNITSTIYNYFTFDDVPDPNRSGEAIFPSGMADISYNMHPAISWWQNYAFRSTVYTGITNSYNYMVYANDHAWHSRATSPAYDDEYHFSTNYTGTNTISGYVNPGNPYHLNWRNANYIYDLLLFYGARGVATNSWLSGLSSDPDSTDSDGDGLPDWWEQLYNLDPNDAAGDNGAWGDPDNDGLNNRAEYLAGTSPRNSDTDGDGIGDYDSRSGPYTRTWGEMFMDGDGMPDTWEIQYGLDPYHYDANLDLDKDGWSNYAEYQAGTNPNDATSYPQPFLFGSADYFGNKSGTLKFFVYNTNTMDGTPKFIQHGADNFITETIGTADGTLYFKGRLPIYPIDPATVVNISATAGTNNTIVTFTFTNPEIYTYSGPGSDYWATLDYVTGRMTLRWASVAVPILGTSVTVAYNYVNRNAAAFRLSGFGEGDFYLLALLDANGNESLDSGEPMGIMEDQPLTMEYSTLQNVKVHLRDAAPGYGRFAWTGNITGTSDYPVVINKISEQNAPTVLTRTMRWSRNFLHEWDYQLAGLYGLPNGRYQWWMNGQQGTFGISWPASVSTPAIIYPRGDLLNYAQNQFKWTMDANSTMYHLQVARQASDRGLAFVIDQYYPIPYCDQDGVSQTDLPLYAGELGNGVYYWRVASWNPAGESVWSDAQTFEINLNATNSHWIAGNMYYFGKADSSNIIVEAYNNRGFSGKPEARILLTGASRTNSFKGTFTLRGLQEGTYYVRAWIDVTPAGGTRDGKRNSPWESWGFIRDPNNNYKSRALSLSGTMFIDGTTLVIRDQDTDNDLLPDAWEMFYFGNLDQTGDMDYDGDDETNLEEYMYDGYDMNPAFWDTDGDGLSDAFEINYTAPSFGYSAKSGQQLNPMLWDTDGDGYSDGAEMKRYHTDPLNPTSYPRYQPMCFDSSRSPGDYDGDGRSDLNVYDIANGNWYLMTAGGFFFNLPFGSSASLPMVGDYSGDGCDDFSLFDSPTGDWRLYDAWTGQSFNTRFGDSEMIPVPADYSGDGKTDLAVYYPAEGTWFIYNLWTGELFTLTFGGPTFVPVPGDYNNDGAADLAIYEPTTGNWKVFALDHYRQEGQYFSGTFGGPTMIPVPGDYDGDGRNDFALFDTSNANWYILTWRGQFLSGQFGCYGCIPVAGDYDGDGRTDVCVYYPPTGMWYILCWSGQSYQVQFGWSAATPALKGR